MSTGFDHRLVFTRNGALVLNAKADVQDAGASIPRNMTGQPGTEATATAYLQDERLGVLVEQFDEVTDYAPNGQIKVGEVETPARELDGAMLLRLDEAGLRHTLIIEHRTETRQPGARVATTWVAEPPEPGRAAPVGGDFSIQSDQPSAAGDWVVTKSITGAIVGEGDRILVKGHEDDDRTKPVIWQRLLTVTKVMPPSRAKDRRQSILAVDTALNP